MKLQEAGFFTSDFIAFSLDLNSYFAAVSYLRH